MAPTNSQINWGFLGYTPTPATGSPYDYSNSSFDLSPQRTNEIMANARADGFGGWDWLGGQGILPTTFMGLQALGGLANAYTGLQQLQLARDQFDFSKNVANANLNNSVENYYNAIKNANRVGYALQGGYARKAYGANSQEAAATNAAEEATKNLTRHV